MNRHRHMHDALASHRRRLVSSAAAAVLLAGWVGPVYADATIDTALEGLAPMTSGDLSGERGGFSFGNMNISFGFSISTTVAGGTLGPGVTVTTNFTINTPGDLKNLGTTITSNVQSTLKDKGLIDDGNPATPTLGEKIEDSVAASVAHLNPDAAPTSAPASTVVASAAAPIPESAVNSVPAPIPESIANPAPAPVVDVTPVVEVTMVSAPDIPPPPEPIADITPPPPPPPPAPIADAAPAPDLPPATKPEIDPAAPATNNRTEVAASVDPATGNIKLALGSGGNILLEYLQGQVSKIQNTENNVQISSEIKADYVIDGYSQVATAVNLSGQVRDLTDQLMALGGH